LILVFIYFLLLIPTYFSSCTKRFTIYVMPTFTLSVLIIVVPFHWFDSIFLACITLSFHFIILSNFNEQKLTLSIFFYNQEQKFLIGLILMVPVYALESVRDAKQMAKYSLISLYIIKHHLLGFINSKEIIRQCLPQPD
jgi:hypothetical protein